jgi:two-component system, OmpR family, response regulator
MEIKTGKMPLALIVDDEGDICYLLSSMLKQRHIRFDQVNTLAQATIALKEETPAIIFLDNRLPDGKGINFIDHIKANCPETKIVIITAHDKNSDKEIALRLGADFFIAKPFTRQQIYETIDQFTDFAA